MAGAMLAAGLTAALTSAAIAPAQGDTICVMSYNVHNAVGMDGIRDVRRIAGVIIASGPMSLPCRRSTVSPTAAAADIYWAI